VRLAFTWLITLCDDDGRCHGDPSVLRGAIFPYKTRLSLKQMDKYLQDLMGVGLIYRYMTSGQPVICIPTWELHQKLRKDKRRASNFAPPDDNALEQWLTELGLYGSDPLCQYKIREYKIREGKIIKKKENPKDKYSKSFCFECNKHIDLCECEEEE